jgi:hypothetical protein
MVMTGEDNSGFAEPLATGKHRAISKDKLDYERRGNTSC